MIRRYVISTLFLLTALLGVTSSACGAARGSARTGGAMGEITKEMAKWLRPHVLESPELFARYCHKIAPKEKASGGLIDLRYTYIQSETNKIAEQMRMLGVPEWFINAKARQVKLTTYWLHRAHWYHCRAIGPRQTDIMGDISETTSTMKEMWDVYYDNLPWWMQRPVRSHVTHKDPVSGAWLRQHTALTPRKRPVQGSTSSTLIATEVPYYTHGESLLLAALNAIPMLPETLVVLEGTAHGASGEFYNRWLQAIEHVAELCRIYGARDAHDLLFNETGWGNTPDRNGQIHPHGYWPAGEFYPLFWAWWQDPEYVASADQEGVTEASLSEYERDMRKAFNLSYAQIAWYRMTLRSKAGGDLKLMQQEYPSTWQEAFIMSGETVFDPHLVSKHMIRTEQLARAYVEKPDVRTGLIRRIPYVQRVELDWLEDREGTAHRMPGLTPDEQKYGYFSGKGRAPDVPANRNAPMFDVYGACTNRESLRVQIAPDIRGRFLFRRKPVTGWDYRYVIGADVAEGLEQGDFSTAFVLDRVKMRFDMMYQGHCDEEVFAGILAMMGVYYDYAPVLVEQNKQGDAVLFPLRKIYPHVMTGARFEKGKMLFDQRLGWKTTDASKPQMVGALKAYLRDHAEGMDFNQPFVELTTFTREPSGRMGAEAKRLNPDSRAYDDLAMGWMVTLMAHKLLPPPMEPSKVERGENNINVFQRPPV